MRTGIGRFTGVLAAVVGLAVAAMLTGCEACGSGVSDSGASLSDTPPVVQREFRGLWVATVVNIDWPSRPGLGSTELRQEMNRILDVAKSTNLNAIMLQVRPSCDAMYPSALEPWSEYLTGVQGQAPLGVEPGFDPLREWVDGAHARSLQLHAWLNPFRARHVKAKSANAPTHIALKHPELVRDYDGYMWLDPGEPEAQAHSLRVVLDLVNRYDLDGVHFDDYFYPYPKKDQPFPDDASFAKYQAAGGRLARDDWRRANIDCFVQDVYRQVKLAKPHVRVGISPFGIWRPGNPSSVAGFDAFAGLYADSRRWLREGWVDYLAPQLYWKISAPKQGYDDLLKWWISQNPKGHDVYVGNYASRIKQPKAADAAGAGADAAQLGSDKDWPVYELVNQIERTRRAAGARGNILYSAIALTQNRQGLADALREGAYSDAALVPELSWSASRALPAAPKASAERVGSEVVINLGAARTDVHQWLIQSRANAEWSSMVVSATTSTVRLTSAKTAGAIDRVVIWAIDRFGRTSRRPQIIQLDHPSAGPSASPSTGARP